MKAAFFRAPGEPLSIETVADPEPGAGEVVVRVSACGICGSDLHMTQPGLDHWQYPENLILGHEYAGEVVALGRDVTNLRVGDRIATVPFSGCGACATCRAGEPMWCAQQRWIHGGYAQYSVATAWPCAKLPEALSLEDGALVEPLAVGLHGLIAAGATRDSSILVIGAGPIGLAVVYWARRMGLKQILVSARTERRRNLAMMMGASRFLTSAELEEGGFGRNGGPADIVFECAGAPGLLMHAIHHVRPCGTVASLGCCPSPDPIVPIHASLKEVRILFPFAYTEAEFNRCALELDGGHVDPKIMVTKRVSLDALPDMFERLRSGSDDCKVLVTPWDQAWH